MKTLAKPGRKPAAPAPRNRAPKSGGVTSRRADLAAALRSERKLVRDFIMEVIEDEGMAAAIREAEAGGEAPMAEVFAALREAR